jgi:hypothetical protein
VLDSLHNQQKIIKEMNELDECMKVSIKEIESTYNNIVKLD